MKIDIPLEDAWKRAFRSIPHNYSNHISGYVMGETIRGEHIQETDSLILVFDQYEYNYQRYQLIFTIIDKSRDNDEAGFLELDVDAEDSFGEPTVEHMDELTEDVKARIYLECKPLKQEWWW